MDWSTVIVGIIGTLGTIIGTVFAYKTRKVEETTEYKIAEINKRCGEKECEKYVFFEEEKKKWESTEEEMKELIAGYAHNWKEATDMVKKQNIKIKNLEKRLDTLEKENKKWKEKSKEWKEKEEMFLKKIYNNSTIDI